MNLSDAGGMDILVKGYVRPQMKKKTQMKNYMKKNHK